MTQFTLLRSAKTSNSVARNEQPMTRSSFSSSFQIIATVTCCLSETGFRIDEAS